MYDPVTQTKTIDPSKATGGMKAILENKLRDQKQDAARMEAKTASETKIKASMDKLKAAALATWDPAKPTS